MGVVIRRDRRAIYKNYCIKSQKKKFQCAVRLFVVILLDPGER